MQNNIFSMGSPNINNHSTNKKGETHINMYYISVYHYL